MSPQAENGHQLSSLQKTVAQQWQAAMAIDIQIVHTYIEQEAKRLSQIYKKQVDVALDGKKGDLNESERAKLMTIKEELKKLGGTDKARELPDDLRNFLIEIATVWQEEKSTVKRTSVNAIAQDASHKLQKIECELNSLNARTGTESLLIAVKGKHEHTLQPFLTHTSKLEQYILFGMKKHPEEWLREIETCVLDETEGLLHNHNQRVNDLKKKIQGIILDGLVKVTGIEKITMEYRKYKTSIVATHHVELINWPDEVPFVNLSSIGSLGSLKLLHVMLTTSNPDKQCRWVKIPEEKLAERLIEIGEKEKARQLKLKRNRDISSSESEDHEDIGQTKKS